MKFIGHIKSERIDDDHIRLLDDFAFIDENEVKWKVPEGFISDGASIPKWIQPIAGHPFDGDFIEAAVIHDYYCKEKTKTQKHTHRAFREALKLDEVPWWKRSLMWAAVRAFNRVTNPQWK